MIKGKFTKVLVNRKKMIRLKITNRILTILFIVVSIGFIVVSGDNLATKKAITESNMTNAELCEGIIHAAEIEKENKDLREINHFVNTNNMGLINSISTMEEQNKELKSNLEASNEALSEMEHAQRLCEEYGYALEYEGIRTDITLDQLKTAEEVCAENNVDMHLLLSVILTESHGIEDAKNSESTASGYGQLIYSTAKSTWEDLYDIPYDPLYALDGEKNIEMTAAYLGKLLDEKSSTTEALYSYRGARNDAYVSKVLSISK